MFLWGIMAPYLSLGGKLVGCPDIRVHEKSSFQNLQHSGGESFLSTSLWLRRDHPCPGGVCVWCQHWALHFGAQQSLRASLPKTQT